MKILSTSRMRFPVLADDENLRGYLLKLRIWFGDPAKSLHYFEIEDAHYEVRYRDKCHEVSSSLKNRAQLLAELVAEEMSGTDQDRECSMPSVDLHLADLMTSMSSMVLGLGFVKYGGALERALLYKVLADRIGLPCALYRTGFAYAWCEVAVPGPDPAVKGEEHENYPAALLRPNYVVDLIVQPGRLLPLGSAEARRITGPPGVPPYTTGKLPDVCRCEKNDSESKKSSDNVRFSFS